MSNNDSSIGKAYMIGGVPVQFPHRAYPSQVSMMDRIVRCLNHRHNCLLESPTGSGKSLALLCSCLAWQRKKAAQIKAAESMLEEQLMGSGVSIPIYTPANPNQPISYVSVNNQSSETSSVGNSTQSRFDKFKYRKEKCSDCKCESNGPKETKRGIVFEDDLEDFQPLKKHRISVGIKSDINDECISSPVRVKINHNDKENGLDPAVGNLADTNIQPESGLTPKINKLEIADSTVPEKLPKIYFGTRTHKQIEQIVRELKKTNYKDIKMTILSSREKTCIHPGAESATNKNEFCEELMKADRGANCRFYRNSKTINHFQTPFESVFNLNDFKKACTALRACPFFGARELLTHSEIVFCPYNYLVDPLIRSALRISLKGNIIVMDEAHNIEDAAREAGSSSFDLKTVEEASKNLKRISKYNKSIPESYSYTSKVLSQLASWMKSNVDNLTDYSSYDSSCKVIAENEMIAVLSFAELGPDKFPIFKSHVDKIIADESDPEKDKEKEIVDIDAPLLLSATSSCLKALKQILTYLYKDDGVFIPDYRCVLRKTLNWLQKYELVFNFWCMNPAVAFSDFRDTAHSVIVASGTLSPMISFQSELGIPFEVNLEANHVVQSHQLWVGTVGVGPDGTQLSATYRNASTFSFQDNIGKVVLRVCKTIPHGVLCFFPSYGMMDNVIKRWETTGVYHLLEVEKTVLKEPRKQSDFEGVIKDFYHEVSNSRSGALLFAVCRGKVSEGLDFADNNARAVITIGIPFPNVRDAQVDLKKKYNDRYSTSRQIMNGGQWYEVQAFRALNQALGRCIRHKNDFGALILADQRFQTNERYVSALSKWIRKEMQHYSTFESALSSLNEFADQTGLRPSDIPDSVNVNGTEMETLNCT